MKLGPVEVLLVIPCCHIDLWIVVPFCNNLFKKMSKCSSDFLEDYSCETLIILHDECLFYCRYGTLSQYLGTVQTYILKKVSNDRNPPLLTFIIPVAPPGTEWQPLADRIREIRHP